MPASAKLLHRYASLIAAIVLPRRYCAARTAASLIRSVGRHRRIARLRYLHCALPTYACCRSRLPYCGTAVFYCLLRCHAIAVSAALLFDDLPSRLRCSRRLVLPIRRHGCTARFDRSAVTMMICPSEGYVIRRRVGTYCRSASRLRRAICAADVLHAIRRATDLSRRPRIAPLP